MSGLCAGTARRPAGGSWFPTENIIMIIIMMAMIMMMVMTSPSVACVPALHDCQPAIVGAQLTIIIIIMMMMMMMNKYDNDHGHDDNHNDDDDDDDDDNLKPGRECDEWRKLEGRTRRP